MNFLKTIKTIKITTKMGQDLHVGKTFNLIDKPERVIITAKHLAVSLAPNSRTSKCRPVCHCLSQQGMYLCDQSLTITLQNTIYSRGILKRTCGCLDGHSILTFQQWRHCEKEWFASAKRICPNQVHKTRIWLPFWNNGNTQSIRHRCNRDWHQPRPIGLSWY